MFSRSVFPMIGVENRRFPYVKETNHADIA
jgi:hypothetical protein